MLFCFAGLWKVRSKHPDLLLQNISICISQEQGHSSTYPQCHYHTYINNNSLISSNTYFYLKLTIVPKCPITITCLNKDIYMVNILHLVIMSLKSFINFIHTPSSYFVFSRMCLDYSNLVYSLVPSPWWFSLLSWHIVFFPY